MRVVLLLACAALICVIPCCVFTVVLSLGVFFSTPPRFEWSAPLLASREACFDSLVPPVRDARGWILPSALLELSHTPGPIAALGVGVCAAIPAIIPKKLNSPHLFSGGQRSGHVSAEISQLFFGGQRSGHVSAKISLSLSTAVPRGSLAHVEIIIARGVEKALTVVARETRALAAGAKEQEFEVFCGSLGSLADEPPVAFRVSLETGDGAAGVAGAVKVILRRGKTTARAIAGGVVRAAAIAACAACIAGGAAVAAVCCFFSRTPKSKPRIIIPGLHDERKLALITSK